MINSLGFDTIIINANRFYSDINQTLETFYTFGIKNFLFIFDYNPLYDSIPLLKEKMNSFKNIYSHTSLRGLKIKVAFNLNILQGAAFNNSINRIYANKNSKSIFVSLPLFTDTNYEPVALDINHLLYKKSTFLILNSFEKNIETSSLDFCLKFINNPRIGISVDLNYLFNPEKELFFKHALNSSSLILPSISKDLSNYVGILSAVDFAIDKYGKKSYYNICTQINKATSRIFG